MKMTLEPTQQFASFGGPDVRCRMWKGTTARGTTVFAFIAAISSPVTQEQDELIELEDVSPDDPRLPLAEMVPAMNAEMSEE